MTKSYFLSGRTITIIREVLLRLFIEHPQKAWFSQDDIMNSLPGTRGLFFKNNPMRIAKELKEDYGIDFVMKDSHIGKRGRYYTINNLPQALNDYYRLKEIAPTLIKVRKTWIEQFPGTGIVGEQVNKEL